MRSFLWCPQCKRDLEDGRDETSFRFPGTHAFCGEYYEVIPLEFNNPEWFHITGRGWACGFKNPDKIFSRALLGREVLIDGVEYLVKGVETFAVSDEHPAARGSFGLLIGERE